MMKPGHEDAAEEQEATIEAEDSAAVVADGAGAAESAIPAMAGDAPFVVPALAAIAAVDHPLDEQVEEDVAVDLEQKAKRKRELYEAVDELYEESELSYLKGPREADEFEEEVSDELSKEDSEDVDHDKDSRDNKSHYIPRKLRTGKISCRNGSDKLDGNISYPFCTKVISKDFNSPIQHAKGIGKGSAKKHQAITKAQYAAFGVFLTKYVKGHQPFFLPPPPHQAKKAKK